LVKPNGILLNWYSGRFGILNALSFRASTQKRTLLGLTGEDQGDEGASSMTSILGMLSISKHKSFSLVGDQ